MKRSLGFLMRHSLGLRETAVPDSRLERVNQAVRRRLDDDLEDMIRRACAGNDLEAAAELLALLKKWRERRALRYGHDRRGDRAELRRIRQELDLLARARTVHRPENEPAVPTSPG